VLFNNQYQLATPGGNVDLYAQVKGASVSKYSWNTSNLAISPGTLTGASTYHLHVSARDSQGRRDGRAASPSPGPGL
jgi:hypothetical protein